MILMCRICKKRMVRKRAKVNNPADAKMPYTRFVCKPCKSEALIFE